MEDLPATQGKARRGSRTNATIKSGAPESAKEARPGEFFTASDGRGFHERAGPSQALSGSDLGFLSRPTSGRRAALPSVLLSSFLIGTAAVAAGRPTGGAFCLRPSLSSRIADSPCFHPHSRWSRSLRCQLGSSIYQRVLPSQYRTGRSVSGCARPAATSQSPELGDCFQT